MDLMPSCPHCGCVLIFFEHYDCDCEVDGGKAFFFADGHCPQCHREYCWTDVYTLSHFEDLEEVDKDERFYS